MAANFFGARVFGLKDSRMRKTIHAKLQFAHQPLFQNLYLALQIILDSSRPDNSCGHCRPKFEHNDASFGYEEVRMFKVGEKVVYPAHGVGEIEAIRSHAISGTERKFYMLRILETDMKIMIPIDNVDSVGLRKIIDRAMVTKVYKVLRQKKVEPDQQTWNRRYREYTEKIKTGSILEIAKVLRDLFVLKGDKELSFGERKMLDTARNLLVKELSIARSHSEEKIMDELRHIFTH